MKSFVYFVLAVFLGTAAVQGYGPKIHRNKIGGPDSPHPFHKWGPPHGPWTSHDGPRGPHHPGFPPHRPPHDNFRPPNRGGHWDDNSPRWDHGSDSSDSSGDCGSFNNYDSDDSYDSSPEHDSSYEHSGNWHGPHHKKRPCIKPPKTSPKPTPTTQKPTSTTPKPTPTTPKPTSTSPKPTTTTPKPTTTTLKPTSTTPKPTTTTKKPTPTTPKPTPTTTKPIPTTTKYPCPTTTNKPIPPITTTSRTTWHPTTPDEEDTTHWETTTSSVPVTTTSNPDLETTTEGEGVTTSPEIEECINRCPSTPEYNPVCGSDGQTYDNEGKLFCAKACGVSVTLRRRSVCPPPNWEDGRETPGTTPPTTTPSYVGRTTPLSDLQKCMRQCRISSSFSPVCGSDFVTYMNIDRLKCAQSCGETVEVLCEKPCAACGINPPTTPKTTTTSNPDLETTTEGFTTISPETEECIKRCPSTPEYNPVCGSDGRTYDNEGKLFCAKSCGVDVTLRRRSVCPPPGEDGRETPGTTPPTTTSPYVGRTTPLSDLQKCMRLCRISPSFSPVCGSDFVTYMNIDRLKCAQSCGETVEVLCEKPCAACGINPPTTTRTTTLRPTTTPQSRTTTLEPTIQKCIKECPVTPEYNPVCGSNHVTYSNPGHLLCAQLCGIDVAVTRLGPCGPTTTTSTTTVAPSTLSPDVLACIRSCPVTSEYDPVCGTDALTYNNLGNLYCAQYCGVDVDLKYKSRCDDEFDLGTDGTGTPTQITPDVNGYKDPVTTPLKTTATTSSLFTSPTTTTTATPPTRPVSTSATTADPNTSSTIGFTIPGDVLDNIFGSTTQVPTIKTTPNPDDDEDLDLDHRFGDGKDDDKETGRMNHYTHVIFPIKD